MDYVKGIDVSEHQGVIDWDKLAASGEVDFVMIRAGYGQGTQDEFWLDNVAACTRLGIPFGVYWFSYALQTRSGRGKRPNTASRQSSLTGSVTRSRSTSSMTA